MNTYRISDSGKSILSSYIFIEAKNTKEAIIKHLKSENIKNPIIKRMDKGYNRYFNVMKVQIIEKVGDVTYHKKAGNSVYYELFKE